MRVINPLSIVFALVVVMSGAMANGQSDFIKISDQRVNALEFELAELGADRITEYLLPERTFENPYIELVFDRHEHRNTRTPATVYTFEKDAVGSWKGQRVDGQIPIGRSSYWAFDNISDETPGYICNEGTIDISREGTKALDALVAADWQHAPQYSERESRHPTVIGVRLLNQKRVEAHYFEYLLTPEDILLSEWPAETMSAFTARYLKLEKFVVDLVREHSGSLSNCDPSSSVRSIPPVQEMDAKYAERFAEIRFQLNKAYAAIRQRKENQE